jgi:hypothetical protein
MGCESKIKDVIAFGGVGKYIKADLITWKIIYLLLQGKNKKIMLCKKYITWSF